ncbi:MAG: hypothetical protein ACQES1_06425 [Bacteroidota bacterium]
MIKKQYIIVFLILINSMTLSGQNKIELHAGVCKNYFHDYMSNDGHYQSSYNPSCIGYSFGVGIENIKVDSLTMRFTLSYDIYTGEIEVNDGGLGSGHTTTGTINKSVISIGVYPLNFKILKKIDLNFGCEISGLVYENNTGTISGWSMGQPYNVWSYDLEDRYDRFSSLVHFGLKSRVAYDIEIAENLLIFPQYAFYYGISSEFKEFPEATKSIRHYFCIGLQRTLK